MLPVDGATQASGDGILIWGQISPLLVLATIVLIAHCCPETLLLMSSLNTYSLYGAPGWLSRLGV